MRIRVIGATGGSAMETAVAIVVAADLAARVRTTPAEQQDQQRRQSRKQIAWRLRTRHINGVVAPVVTERLQQARRIDRRIGRWLVGIPLPLSIAPA
jgi:hypothetical protein